MIAETSSSGPWEPLNTRTACKIAPLLSLPAALLLFSSAAFAQAADPKPAKPAVPHDTHEGVTLTADPYADLERTKAKFGKNNPYEAGILALDVTLRNDNPYPIRVNVETIQLEVRMPSSGRQDISWLSAVETADLIAHPKGLTGPSSRRLPGGIPLPNHDKKTDKIADELRPMSLDADIIAPGSAIHGFLFFNLGHQMALAKTSSLYVPDVVTLPENKTLLFFEVALAPPPPAEPAQQ